jgi:uncharacterized repeat protein (TIGR03943 family)
LLLVPAVFIAMGFMIAAMAGNRTTEVDLSSALRAAVLLLPLVYLVGLPDAMLGGLDFKNRFVGTGGIASANRESSGEGFPWEGRKIGADPPSVENDPPMSETSGECSIADLYRSPERYIDQHVVFTGMIMRDEALKSYFGGKDTAVYRFLITCCAADALPLAVAVDAERSKGFESDQWVRVAGIFSLHRMDGKPVPQVINAAIEPIEPPAIPYLF